MDGFGRIGIPLLIGLVASGCSGDIQIGALISETGAYVYYGEKVKKGLDLAAEQINAEGGVNGSPVQLIYRDDESKAQVGREAIIDMIDDLGLRIVIGAVSSAVTLEVAPICERSRTLLFSPTASAPRITDAGDYIFRNYPSDVLEGTIMADFAARTLGLERVVVFAADNEFGAGLKDVFTQKYQSKYRKVVATFDFPEADPAALGPMVAEAVQLDPEGIYIAGYLNDVAELLNQIHEAGIQAMLLGTASLTEDIVTLSGLAAEHLIYPQPPFDLESQAPEVRSFIDAYRERYGEDPDGFAAHGYDALRMIAVAIERAGSKHPDSVKSALANLNDYRGPSGATGFNNDGDVVQYPRLFVIIQGRAMPYERFIEEGGTLAALGLN